MKHRRCTIICDSSLFKMNYDDKSKKYKLVKYANHFNDLKFVLRRASFFNKVEIFLLLLALLSRQVCKCVINC